MKKNRPVPGDRQARNHTEKKHAKGINAGLRTYIPSKIPVITATENCTFFCTALSYTESHVFPIVNLSQSVEQGKTQVTFVS